MARGAATRRGSKALSLIIGAVTGCGCLVVLFFAVVAAVWIIFMSQLPPEAFPDLHAGMTDGEVVALCGEPVEVFGKSEFTPASRVMTGYESPPREWQVEHELWVYPYGIDSVAYIYIDENGIVTRVFIGYS
jgi:hypothetical protein